LLADNKQEPPTPHHAFFPVPSPVFPPLPANCNNHDNGGDNEDFLSTDASTAEPKPEPILRKSLLVDREKIDRLTIEKQQLVAELVTSKESQLAAEERATKLQSDKNDLIQRRIELVGANERKDKVIARLEAFNKKLLQRDINATTAKHQLKAALEASRHSQLAAEECATKLQSDKNDLIQERIELEGASERKDREIAMLRGANKKLLLQHDSNTTRLINQLTKDKQELKAALDTSKQSELAGEERATKLQSEKNDLIQETKKLSGRISEVRATNEQALRQANLEKLGLMGELARSKERIKELEFEKKQLVIQENIYKEVHRTQEQKVATFGANKAFFQSQLNMFQTSNTALVEKVEALEAELAENVAALKAQNNELVDKVDTLEAELVEKDTALKAQIIRSQTTNAELGEKVASLETQLTSSQATNAELVDKVEALETELAEKVASLDDEATVSLHDFVVEPVGGSSDNPILLDDSEVENEDIDSEHSIQANRDCRNSKPRKRALRELNQLTAAHNHSPKRTRTRETSARTRNISTRRRGGILL
jgi:hypothetical protein